LNEFLKRTLSGAVFIILVLGSILWNPWSLFILLCSISGIALFEFYTLYKIRHYTPLFAGGITSGFLILLLVILERQSIIPQKFLFLAILPIAGIWFSFLAVKRKDIINSLIITVAGLIYVLLPLSLIPFITQNQLTSFNYKPEIIIGVLIVLWSNDTAAYLTGISLGRHKMAPAISPKKSWEGFFGGLMFAMLAGYFLGKFSSLLNSTDWIVLSIIIVLTGTAGDLFESLIKREAGVKDSGKIMPGHGGILDRFDSLFMVIPFVFLYLYLIKI